VLGISVETLLELGFGLSVFPPTLLSSEGRVHRFGEALAAGQAVQPSEVKVDGF